MGANGSGGGGRAARALRLLLLVVLTLAAVEYLFGSILDASPLRTYIYTPLYNVTQLAQTDRSTEKVLATWPKSTPYISTQSPNAKPNITINTNKTIISILQKASSTHSSVNMTKIEDKHIHIANNMSETIRQLVSSTEVPSVTKKLDLDVNYTTSTPFCELPPDLGPITPNKTELKLQEVEKMFPEVLWGGQYIPPNCTASSRVAIIVPYRDRMEHLPVFLRNLHPFLMKQQIEYGIFIIEQDGKQAFNRAKLFNVGFKESEKFKKGGWDCFIFHDIDLLPLDTRNLYSCPRQPRHMSASIDKYNFKLPYDDIFGGVSAMTKEQFVNVNGFSNKYWGWGGEDDDMSYRIRNNKYHLSRYKMSIARYTMLRHKPSPVNPKRHQLLSSAGKTFHIDGLNSLKYEIVKVIEHHLYTHIVANIDQNS